MFHNRRLRQHFHIRPFCSLREYPTESLHAPADRERVQTPTDSGIPWGPSVAPMLWELQPWTSQMEEMVNPF